MINEPGPMADTGEQPAVVAASPARTNFRLLDFPGESALVILLLLAGLSCFGFQLTRLWRLWTTDDLRSIGIFFPFLSLVLAWRAMSRTQVRVFGGSVWGLVLMALAMGCGLFVSLGAGTRIHLPASVQWSTFNFLPIGLLLWVYFSGAVIWLGGGALWRVLAFPLMLLLFVNPVPAVFTLVDLPLQSLGAHTARVMAGLIGVPVEGKALTLMFANNLGIFIAPGCNGMRGAATMAYLALVVGHLYDMPRRPLVLYVFAAITLAYLLNLLRLCGVIIFYWFALRFPVLGDYGTEADYLIGGTLFFVSAALFLQIPRWRRAA